MVYAIIDGVLELRDYGHLQCFEGGTLGYQRSAASQKDLRW